MNEELEQRLRARLAEWRTLADDVERANAKDSPRRANSRAACLRMCATELELLRVPAKHHVRVPNSK